VTLIAAWNFGDYVLLVADTRMSYYPPDRPPFWEDGRFKIEKTRLGLMTGCGFGPLLDGVKSYLSDHEVTDTEDIVEAIKAERAKLPTRWLEDPRIADSVSTSTGWFFTYIGAGSTKPGVDNSAPGLRLVASHPNNDYVIKMCGVNDGMIGFPPGVDSALRTQLSELLNSNLKSVQDLPEFEEHVMHHIRIAAQIIAAVSRVDDSVSTSLSVGIHLVDGAIRIFNPTHDPAVI
jgi:hypothetical protein